MTLHEMTERAVAQGHNRAESIERLYEGFKNHSGANLAYYLQHWGFATERKAHLIAAEHQEMLNRN